MARRPLDRRQFLKVTAAAASAASLVAGGGNTAAARVTATSGNVADGVTGRTASFPLSAVRLGAGPFADNQARNTSYLHFVDADRLLHTFRRNVGLPSSAKPCGGWEHPDTELRGHSTGHLLSGLAITYANTGDQDVLAKGRYLVSQLAACQERSAAAGFHPGYLSAFPESFFDRLETGTAVWAPYYTIHKIMAGLLDQYSLTGNDQALHVVTRMADWIDWRTARLDDATMQEVMAVEFGGINEALANVYAVTGAERHLIAAQRFYDREIFDPLAAGVDDLVGRHANTQIAKVIGALRIWEHTGDRKYRDIARNFWDIVVHHHTYIIGGNSEGEYFHEPDVIAGNLSNFMCENCNSYNMLKLTRLLHFAEPRRTDLLDYYERTLFNQMLGEQDPDSAHGFNIYYTGLCTGAIKQQPSFMGDDPDVYSTDYDNFSCDHGTGMETQAKFADTIYSRGGDDLFVNLFIPSEVSWPERNLVLRQENAFPDEASSRLVMTSADGPLTLRVRVPSWVDGPPRVLLNGEKIRHTARPGSWLTLRRQWRAGDTVDLSLPMSVKLNPTPDDPDLQAVTVGPIVLCGDYGDQAMMPTPRLDTTSVRRTIAKPMTFTAKADGQDVSLMPISRMHHRHHTAYWRTGAPPPPPPPFAAWYRFDETRGTTATDSSGHRKKARLVGGTSWTTGRIGGAVQLNGEDGHVQLPGVLSGATEYSVATWVRLDALPAWAPIFCFGVGTTAHMFLNANSSENTMCYTISARGYDGGQRIDAAVLPIGSWHHVAVTHGDGIGVLYVDGAEVGRNTAMPVQPRWFGSEIKQSYLGRSAFETYLPGALDDFRIYGRVLSPSEVGSLAAG